MGGLGVASTQILPAISNLPHIKVAAAADVRKDALKNFEREYGGRGFESFEAMCASPDVDAVYVATPNEWHARHVITAANHGKHVIVEKPMALGIEECEAMNAAAEKNRVQLLCGHTHSFDPPIRKIREIVKSGELGPLCMIHSWNFNEFMYRPRMKHELATSRGVVLNQGPHQVDVVRLIGGGKVRSVRATTGIWDPKRPHEGSYVCYLEFENGVPATLVYSGYGFFDTAELFWWIGEGGNQRDPETNVKARRNIKAIGDPEKEEALKEQMRYGQTGAGQWLAGHRGGAERHQPFFGLTLVSCASGDIRQSPDGLVIYGDNGKREIGLPPGKTGREAEVEELYQAVVNQRPVFHGGRWGEATLEVCLALLESAQTKREIQLSHQVPSPE